MEIGGEFWIEEQQTFEDKTTIPAWLNRFGEVTLTSSGRGAISLALQHIQPKMKTAVLPAYTCETVIIPFEEAGYEITYYPLDTNMEADVSKIDPEKVGVFLHMGYFGFPTNDGLRGFVSELKDRSVVIIEDVTHTLFSNYQRDIENDYMVGSIRKWFGTPSGGFMASKEAIPAALGKHPGEFIKLRTLSLQKKNRYIQEKKLSLKPEFLAEIRRAEDLLDEYVHPFQMDERSQQILNRVDEKKLIGSRMENYQFLLQELKSNPKIEIIFDESHEEVCPLYFPVYIKENRSELIKKLIEAQIYCPVHWPIPEQAKSHLTPETLSIYNTVMSIPCDQRYNIDDMQRVTELINTIVQ